MDNVSVEDAREEEELKKEGERLEKLQESLLRTNQLCNEMIKELEQFEARVASLEPQIMPLHRNVSLLSRVHNSTQSPTKRTSIHLPIYLYRH